MSRGPVLFWAPDSPCRWEVTNCKSRYHGAIGPWSERRCERSGQGGRRSDLQPCWPRCAWRAAPRRTRRARIREAAQLPRPRRLRKLQRRPNRMQPQRQLRRRLRLQVQFRRQVRPRAPLSPLSRSRPQRRARPPCRKAGRSVRPRRNHPPRHGRHLRPAHLPSRPRVPKIPVRRGAAPRKSLPGMPGRREVRRDRRRAQPRP